MLITEQVFLRRLLMLYTYPLKYPNPLANDLAEIVRIQARLLDIIFDPTHIDLTHEQTWEEWLVCWKNCKEIDRQVAILRAMEGWRKE